MRAELQIEQVLATTVDVTFDQATVEEVAAWVRKHGIKVVVDRKALEESGIDPDTNVSLSLKQVSLEAALRLLLNQHDIVTTVADDTLVLTTSAVAYSALTIREYPVGDLIVQRDPKGREVREPEIIELFVTRICAPTSWEAVGGSGTIQVKGDSLIVKQSWGVQREVRRQIAQLRTIIKRQAAGDYTSVPCRIPSPVEVKITQALDRKVDFAVKEMPLRKFATLMSEIAGVNVLLDERFLADKGLDVENTTITGEVKAEPLRKALARVFREPELMWYVTNDVLLIGPSHLCHAEECFIYPVADLLPEGEAAAEEAEKMIKQIESTIVPTTWDNVGGPGRIDFEPAWRIMFVVQTTEVHELINDHFNRLRTERAERQAKPAKPAAGRPQPKAK